MNGSALDYSDVQGLVRFGYGALTAASYLLLRIREARAASAWLVSAPVSTAVELDKPPQTAMQVAFTREGLEALNLPPSVLAGFSAEFLTGMCGEENRSRRLGDTGANSSQYWRWGGPGKVPHVLVMLYAEEGKLAEWTESIKGPAWETAFELMDCLPTPDLQGVEPFGFTDGISQPTLDWERQRQVKGDQLDYSNVVSLGEFLLGYPNEYGKYTDRPLLPNENSSAALPEAEDKPGLQDLGRNGSYLVFRQLEQDLRGFWQFADRQANGNPQQRERLAAAMVGRTRNGDPLAPLTNQPIPGVDPGTPSNQFTYDSDAAGTRCPFGAHIRRANPRNADLPSGVKGLLSKLVHTLGFGGDRFRDDLISSVRFHRLLRRGREYGSELSPEQALQPGYYDSEEHGINFICLNANISRQFEFVQGAWLMTTKFNGMAAESDPLLGNRQPVPGWPATDRFGLPQENAIPQCISGLPQFVTVRGGAYFFLPGIRALKYLTTLTR